MIERYKIYLDTSVISYLLASDTPDKQQITVEFWRNVVTSSVYEVYLSDFVFKELNQCQKEKREKLFEYLREIRYNNIETTDSILELAYQYIQYKVLTARHIVDALHIAAATIGGCNVLVSWDINHIVRTKTIIGINFVNLLTGFRFVEITTPEDLKEGIR